LFLLIKGTLFWQGITCHFFGNPGSKVAWSRWGSNLGPLDSQPETMAICHDNPSLHAAKECLSPGISGQLIMRIKFSLESFFRLSLKLPVQLDAQTKEAVAMVLDLMKPHSIARWESTIRRFRLKIFPKFCYSKLIVSDTKF